MSDASSFCGGWTITLDVTSHADIGREWDFGRGDTKAVTILLMEVMTPVSVTGEDVTINTRVCDGRRCHHKQWCWSRQCEIRVQVVSGAVSQRQVRCPQVEAQRRHFFKNQSERSITAVSNSSNKQPSRRIGTEGQPRHDNQRQTLKGLRYRSRRSVLEATVQEVPKRTTNTLEISRDSYHREINEDQTMTEACINGSDSVPSNVKQSTYVDMGWCRKMSVYEQKPITECYSGVVKLPVKVRWISHNKWDRQHMNICSKLVCKQLRWRHSTKCYHQRLQGPRPRRVWSTTSGVCTCTRPQRMTYPLNCPLRTNHSEKTDSCADHSSSQCTEVPTHKFDSINVMIGEIADENRGISELAGSWHCSQGCNLDTTTFGTWTVTVRTDSDCAGSEEQGHLREGARPRRWWRRTR